MQSAHVTHQLGAFLRRRALDRKPWLATLCFDTLTSRGSSNTAPRHARRNDLLSSTPLTRP